MKKKKEGKKLFLSDLVLIPICLIFLYPFYYLVINTFKPMTEMSFNPVAFPKTLFLDNYKDIFSQAQIYRAFGNTLIITVCSVLLIVVIGEMAAYPIVFNANKLNNAFMVYLMIGFLVPFQAILLSLFEVMQALKLIDTIHGMILFYCNGSALTVFLAVGYMRTIPRELTEAAIVDGCSVGGVFFRIVFPLMKPITATSIIFNTMWIWNDYLLPVLVLDTKKYKTISIAIQYLKGGYGSIDMGAMMGVLVLSILPIIVFYLFCQRYIIEGVAAGAVKG